MKPGVRTQNRKLKAAGLKLVQLWVSDPGAIGFAAECRRQSHIIENDPAERQDLEMLTEIADWGKAWFILGQHLQLVTICNRFARLQMVPDR